MMKVMGGICFAHGEYHGDNCPQWPACGTAPPQLEYLKLGAKRHSESRMERAYEALIILDNEEREQVLGRLK